MYIALMCFLIILSFAVIYYGKNKQAAEEPDKKEHPLRILYPLAEKIYGFIKRHFKGELFGRKEVLKEIYPDVLPEKAERLQADRCIASATAIIMGTCLLIFAYGYTASSQLTEGVYLKRKPAGDGDTAYSLMYEREYEEGEFEKKVSVSETRLEGEAFESLKQRVTKYLDKAVLSDNESAENIRSRLYFSDSIPGTGVHVEWKNDTAWIVSSDGELKNDDLDEPVRIMIQAELSYYEKHWTFEKYLTVMPREYSAEELFDRQLGQLLEENDAKNLESEYFELPQEVEGEKVSWSEKKDNTKELILFLGVFGAFCMFPLIRNELNKKQEIRKNQMLADYPDIVSKMALLFSAGMTCRAAWTKISIEYQKEKEGGAYGKNGFRYAYEEMLQSLKELNLGEPEVRVYEKFGIRCNVPEYRRFSTLLTRNLRWGSAEIVGLLETEASEAFEERKAAVRRKGEEAGTKLLIPMFGMLIIVFAIVMVPAFSNL